MKVRKTPDQLEVFDNVAGSFLHRLGYIDERGAWNDKPNTKLVSAVKNIIKQILKINKTLSEEFDLVREKYALTDKETGAILYAKVATTISGGYQHTPEGVNLVRKGINKIKSEKEFDIHQRIQEDWVEKLNEEEIEAFSGLVIPDGYSPSQEPDSN